jgi:monoamine oxidase
MGGTWIDPRQTQSWAEAQAYGIRIGEPVFGAPPRTWLIGGNRSTGPFPVSVRGLGHLERLIRHFGNDASRIDASRPLNEQSVVDLDIPLTEYVSGTGAPPDLAAAATAYLSMYGSAPPEDISALHLLRRMSAAGSFAEFVMSGASHPLVEGTDALLSAIVKDGDAQVVLSSPVDRIVQTQTGVSVFTSDRAFRCRCAVLTVPVNTWKQITFEPALSSAKRRLSEEELACQGFKVWLLVRGVPPGFSACGDGTPFGLVWTEEVFDDGAALLVAYGNDAAETDIADPHQLQIALRAFIPEAELLEHCGHDWRRDRWSLETWPVFKPSQITRYEEALRAPEGRVLIAGTATALRWPGFIDGAIESGKCAAEEADRLLREERSDTVFGEDR